MIELRRAGPSWRRIHVRLVQHLSSEQARDLQGIDLVVLGLAAMNGLHVEGVAEDKSSPERTGVGPSSLLRLE